ncbi:squamous cell carcinoma antigen recognized by T-cells 3 [Paragonimus westermani]|uniref:Squamous cell carcinoma antigen recognized by T-cells 3 n=1 Tax=Paragonimus westermani TaxID=34504 RepID=A0A5J4NNZ1_9TREM|nr:squamous cell carcinoma antigen recognized by T-cells 3 [Paragonimus westermani]
MTNESLSESSDSPSDSEKDDYDDNEDKLKEEVIALRLQLESFPNSYELHTRLINSLRKLGNLDELSAARENMNAMYPLSPNNFDVVFLDLRSCYHPFFLTELWLDWIEDERKIATSDDEKRKVEGLFKRAVEDYDDPSIWQEYCLFAIGNLQPGSAESIRATEHIFETALSHQGLNVAAANSLWEIYRDLQLVLFGQQNPSSAQLTEDRLKCIDKLYRRQLRLPLLAMESTLEAYEEFLKHSASNLYPQQDQTSSLVPPDCMKEYEKAKAQLSLLLPFEERIEAASAGPETDSVAAWEAYLDWIVSYPRDEPSDGVPKRKSKSVAEEFSPNHVCCLFERAITAHCLQATIWLRFVSYLENKLPSDRQRLLHVLARSVRNCPWSVDLWLQYAMVSEMWVNDELLQTASNGLENHVDRSALERTAFAKVEGTSGMSQMYSQNVSFLLVVFEAALSAGLEQQADLMEIWLAYCDFRLRRLMSAQPSTAQWDEQLNNLRSIFERANQELYRLFTYKADPDGLLVQYEALVEAKYVGDMGRARSAWSHLMQQSGNGSQSRFWLAYLQFERNFGDSKHLFRLCRMAVNSISSATEADHAFPTLLRLAGEAALTVTQIHELVMRTRTRRIELAKRATIEKTKFSGSESPNIKPQRAVTRSAIPGEKKIKKRAHSTTDSPTVVTKKAKSSESEQLSDEQSEQSVKPQVVPDEDVKRLKPHGLSVAHDSSKDDRTVFVSNLDYSVSEDEVRATFESCGTISSIRLVRDYAGRSKGYAYVEFSNPQAVPLALAKDRQPVASETAPSSDEIRFARPMFVSQCDPSRTKVSGFHYTVGRQEPQKLFVRNLDRRVTKQTLEQLFGEHGTVVSVRLACYRNGAPKGHAYVEFSNANEASRALIATDGLLLQSKRIAVAISNPPVRKSTASGTPTDSSTSKQAVSQNVSDMHDFRVPNAPPDIGGSQRAHSRTQLAFLPRAINLHAMSSASELDDKDNSEGGAPSERVMRSNADFRKMFLS